MAELLISVRSVAEAKAALMGGAAIIDVKEPKRGALGQADPETIAAVLHFVGGRRPVSAAMGELVGPSAISKQTGLAFAKWGLAGCRHLPDWRDKLKSASRDVQKTFPGCQPVAAAYADWQRAEAPPPNDVAEFARTHRCGAFLLDTWGKDGTTLLDWMPLPDVVGLCQHCQRAGVPVALAGSLNLDWIRELRVAEPSWFAIRGAACRAGERGGEICTERVRGLANAINGPTRAD